MGACVCMCVCERGGGGEGGGGGGVDSRPIQDQGMNLMPHVSVYSIRLSLYHVP